MMSRTRGNKLSIATWIVMAAGAVFVRAADAPKSPGPAQVNSVNRKLEVGGLAQTGNTPGTHAGVTSPREFSHLAGMVPAPEQAYRQELCLNGLWQFQPVPLPKGYKQNQGVTPDLPPPLADEWSKTPIKIPSHWNVNTWGGGRIGKRPADQLYWPDSVYFPSYPAEWDRTQMGWLRRGFRVPEGWRNKRVILHFEAVSGECQVLLNGQNIAHHFDNYLPFEIDATDHIRWDGENELLVGVRGQNLFNKPSRKYPKFMSPYPPGSMTDSLIGIWQDVFLLALPNVRVADAFVKPMVTQGILEVAVVLANDSMKDETVKIAGDVCPWTNLTGKDLLAPRKWKLEPPVMSLPAEQVTIKAGQKATLVLRQPAKKNLNLWSPKSPNLYGLVLSVSEQGKLVDCQYTRFGWREYAIKGSDLLLNGEKIKAFGDFVHPFGAYVMSPDYVRAWYQMIKDVGGNALRAHAQIHPRFYLDIADEMGLVVMAETAVFGSSIRLNPEDPAFWERYEAQYDGMVLRDRNHPSVMGWSFGNEMFAIPMLNKMSKEDADTYYDKLIAMSKRSLPIDPTRTWITCDGDEDLRGTLPVWSKHFGHGDSVGKLPKDLNKPLVVGESGGTYYATPEQLSVFNGDRAFESYLGRNEALAIDLYANIVNMALPHLASFSPSLLCWYGLEHLNLGYSDFSRMPTEKDGVFFAGPFVEGKPGMQPERIPPYVMTFNPGWDPSLPLYKPLPMFHAMKAALAPGGPQPCPWGHKVTPEQKSVAAAKPTVEEVAFAGAENSPLRERLAGWGVSLAGGGAQGVKFLVIDGQSLTGAHVADARAKMDGVLAAGGTVLVMICDNTAPVQALNSLLPEPLALTDRKATLLQPKSEQAWAAGLGLKDLNFSQKKSDCKILKCGMGGPFVEKGGVVLEASNTDWSLFNENPEKTKAGAVELYERLQKPSGAALVQTKHGKGTLAVCSIDFRLDTPLANSMWSRLLGNMGVKIKSSKKQDPKGSKNGKEHDLLLNGPVE